MSAEATNWVWKHSQSAGSDRLVLLALADFCNEKAECYASYGTLVRKTRLGQKTVYRCLKSLQSAGEVEEGRDVDVRVLLAQPPEPLLVGQSLAENVLSFADQLYL